MACSNIIILYTKSAGGVGQEGMRREGRKRGGVRREGRRRERRRWRREGDVLRGKKDMDNMLPNDTTAGEYMTTGNRRKNYFVVVVEGVGRKARLF